MALNSFADLKAFITSILKANGDWASVGNVGCPHKDFWDTLTYTEFTTGNVPGVTDGSGSAVPILKTGDSRNSALIQVLSGTGIAAPTGFFNQMPDGGTPFSTSQIAQIADWIDRGCPE
jgi:hypothetical protein